MFLLMIVIYWLSQTYFMQVIDMGKRQTFILSLFIFYIMSIIEFWFQNRSV